MEDGDRPAGASLVPLVTMETDTDVAASPETALSADGSDRALSEGRLSPMAEVGVSQPADPADQPPAVGQPPTEDQQPPEGPPPADGLSLAAPEVSRTRSAPSQPCSRRTSRSPEVGFRRAECRSAEDMMLGTRQFRNDLSDYFSNMDPSQFHFYDFGIQDFLVMKSHQNVDMSHEDEEVQHGDFNIGMNVSPGPYLSDSDLSVASIELSPAQVLWEKKLLDDTSILRNCLLKRGRRQALAAQESSRGRLQALRRRATELCFGHQRVKNVGRKILSRPLSVTEMGVADDNSTRSHQSSLDVGDDCTTIGRPSLDIAEDCVPLNRSSLDLSQCGERGPGVSGDRGPGLSRGGETRAQLAAEPAS
ncbi:hypothetical protein FJT64_006787 [Amphibalanus amphitrite]|uniref:Uncharacterized protein n=1 Tax=Amphibalanus amphitrite TaxID=1232801 RepID=A0A6A4VW98_AMPAM|nr:hypothetical protein FJT64_006787 [Amphibalanus amphitrite]